MDNLHCKPCYLRSCTGEQVLGHTVVESWKGLLAFCVLHEVDFGDCVTVYPSGGEKV